MWSQEGKQHIGEETGPADLGSGWNGNKVRWYCDEEMSDRASLDCGKPQFPKSINFYYLQHCFFCLFVCLRKWKWADIQEQFRDVRRRWWHPTPVLLPGKSHARRSLVGCSPWVSKSWTRLSALEKEMATHSRVLAWRIPGTGEPGGLPSMGSYRVRHDWSDLAAGCIKDGRDWRQEDHLESYYGGPGVREQQIYRKTGRFKEGTTRLSD